MNFGSCYIDCLVCLDLPHYRCAECHRTFNTFTSAPVAGLRNKDRWLDQARALIEAESLAKAAKLGLSAEQVPVVVARDHSGAMLDAVLPRLDATSLKEAFG